MLQRMSQKFDNDSGPSEEDDDSDEDLSDDLADSDLDEELDSDDDYISDEDDAPKKRKIRTRQATKRNPSPGGPRTRRSVVLSSSDEGSIDSDEEDGSDDSEEYGRSARSRRRQPFNTFELRRTQRAAGGRLRHTLQELDTSEEEFADSDDDGGASARKAEPEPEPEEDVECQVRTSRKYL